MKKIILLVSCWALSLAGFSQKRFFLYIQAEGEQPFYCQWEGKTLSSTASGYLVVPQLIDSVYQFRLGFSDAGKGVWQFKVEMARKDQGFLLKAFGEKGWGLFNLQSLVLQMGTPVEPPQKEEPVPVAVNGDAVSPFARLLALASDDPSLMVRPVIVSEPAKASPVTAALTPAAVQGEPVPLKESPVPVAVTKTEEPPLPVKEKPVEPETDTVFMVNGPAVREPQQKEEPAVPVPVAVIKPEPGPEKVPAEISREKAIPASVAVKEKDHPLAVPADSVEKTSAPVMELSKPVTREKEVTEVSPQPYVPATVRRYAESSTTEGFGLVFIDQYGTGRDTVRILIPNPPPPPPGLIRQEAIKEPVRFIETIEAGAPAVPPPAKDSVPVAVSPCARPATESDFFSLRKQMAAAEGDSAMLAEAVRYFPQACFSAVQLRNLGVLFLGEEGRYRFFEAARPYVTDRTAYAALESAFQDPVWQRRFRESLNP